MNKDLLHGPKETQLEDVIIGLLMGGASQGALVRPAQEGAQEGVCALMLTPYTVGRLGKALIPLTEKLGGVPDELKPREVDGHTRIHKIFAACDTLETHWYGFTFRFSSQTEVLGIVFAGSVCVEVAAICNAHGAPCSLDPQKPAPGYELIGRKKG